MNPGKPIHHSGVRLVLLLFYCSGLQYACTDSSPQQTHDSPAVKTNPNGRHDAWGFAGPGGGGAMFYPAVSPHNPSQVFVSCDMTGSFVTKDGGTSWRMFDLRAPIDFYVFDPQDSNVIYANSIALFRSTDGGSTWQVVYPQPSDITGIVSKGDHAEEVVVTQDSTSRKVLAFAVDPANSKKLFAAIQIGEAVAFYESDDGGEHWKKEKDLADGAKNIYVVPSSPKENRTIYLTGQRTVSVRKNGSWQLNKGPKGVQRLTEFTGGFDQKQNKYIIYAISGKSYFNPAGDQSGIYVTEDGGVTWENRQEGLASMRMQGADMPEWRSLATSALHPEIIYLSYDKLKVHQDTTCIGVAKSEDYGKTWQLAWKDQLVTGGGQPSPNMNDGWINERFGPSWAENPFSMGVAPTNPAICYATDFGRTIKTTDGGKSWEQVYTKKKDGMGWTSRGLEVTTSYSVAFDPFEKNHLFITTTDIGLMESKDGGESWASVTRNNGVPSAWVNSTYWLAFDPTVKNKVWAVMSGTHDLPRPKMWRKSGISQYKGGVLVSEDGGKSWQPTSKDIGEAAVTHVLIDPASSPAARTLYVCAFGKGVYKSTDGGKNWKQKNQGIEGNEPFAWRMVRREKDGALFLIVARRSEDGRMGNQDDGALYRSVDGAETWTRVALPAETNGPTSLALDPDHPENLLLSAWGRKTDGKFLPDVGGGIFLSKDDGATWTQVMKKDQHIHDITIDVRNHVYYACGFNASAYRSEDRGNTWQRIKGYNFKWGKRVEPDPRNPGNVFIITFGGGVWVGPAKGDDQAVEDITTPVVAYGQ